MSNANNVSLPCQLLVPPPVAAQASQDWHVEVSGVGRQFMALQPTAIRVRKAMCR